MKLKNFLFNGAIALFSILLFSQCNNANSGTNQANSNSAEEKQGTTNLKIAYVEIDSLLTKYDFWNDLNEMMLQKEENIRATLNQKSRELENEAMEFQRKLENGAYTTRERAEQENNRLIKKQQDLQDLQTRLTNELAAENQEISIQLRDSINSYLKIYNQDKGYSFIISNTGFDNLLYADETYNITNEIVEGLNRRYTPSVSAPKK